VSAADASPLEGEVRRPPAAELRTSLALAALAAALVHLMKGAHGGGGVLFGVAAVQAGVAALLAFTGSRAVLGPALGFNAVLTIGVPSLLATPAQLAVAAGAAVLLRGASDRAYTRWARIAFGAFILTAFTGFGHLSH
jgi:hypothetical protein